MAEKSHGATIRHKFADRLFHWGMALAVVVLGATAFLPILGLKFEWVPWHWAFGVLLAALVLFHLYRVIFVHGLGNMMPARGDLRELAGGTEGLPPAKYDVFQKLYHWAVAGSVLAIVGTGLLMLFKIDTIFWSRNPAIMTDANWGIVYVLHGAGAMILLFLFILHLYFNARPEHRELLASMLRGPGPNNVRGD